MTIDADTEALLKEEARRTGQSFKAVLNQAVKQSLVRRTGVVRIRPLFPAPFPSQLARQSFNRLAAEWDDEETAQKISS